MVATVVIYTRKWILYIYPEVGNVEGADKFEPRRDRNGEVDGTLTFHDDIVFGNDLVDETAAP
jgi:hypothetical protein